MKLHDSRRLTGLNLQSAGPGALADVRFEPGESVEAVLTLWREAMAEIGEGLPFPITFLATRT